MAIRSVSNDDGGVIEDGKKAVALDWQNNNMHHAFWYISLSSLPDYDVKLLNFTFCGGGERTTMTFFFFSCTSTQSFRIQVQRKIANIWRVERNGISAIKVWSSATSLFKWRFRSRCPSLLLKVPNIKRFVAAKLPLFQASTNFDAISDHLSVIFCTKASHKKLFRVYV